MLALKEIGQNVLYYRCSMHERESLPRRHSLPRNTPPEELTLHTNGSAGLLAAEWGAEVLLGQPVPPPSKGGQLRSVATTEGPRTTSAATRIRIKNTI